MKPIRIQRKRTKGWKMPKNTIYVGRGSIWGNPFKATDMEWGKDRPSAGALVICYEILMKQVFTKKDELSDAFFETLRGKNLACWCPLDQPCHADVLLRIANSRRGLP